MNKLLHFCLSVLILSGCSTTANGGDNFFEKHRNYDIGRNVDWSYAGPPLKVSSHNEQQDRYLFKGKGDCEFAYYVNKETKIVESWEYVSSPDKCSMGTQLLGPW